MFKPRKILVWNTGNIPLDKEILLFNPETNQYDIGILKGWSLWTGKTTFQLYLKEKYMWSKLNKGG